MALREKLSSMNIFRKCVEVQSDSAAKDMPGDSVSHSKTVSCRGSWPNIVLCIIIVLVALLLALPLMVFYIPRDDEPDVRYKSLLNHNFNLGA